MSPDLLGAAYTSAPSIIPAAADLHAAVERPALDPPVAGAGRTSTDRRTNTATFAGDCTRCSNGMTIAFGTTGLLEFCTCGRGRAASLAATDRAFAKARRSIAEMSAMAS